jgi:polyisoprenoid-binding protein YceI
MKLSSKFLLLAGLVLGFVGTASAAVETYAIDPAHSSVGFTVRHLFSQVPGSFTKFNGTLMVDRDHMENSSVEATIDIGSVNTAVEKRDNHLKSPDFFDAMKFPTITFKSKSWKKTGTDSYDVTGDLTIKDVTKSVVLAVKVLGFGPGMGPGVMVSGWEGTTTLMRGDFGVNGPAMLGKAVGDEVKVTISVEADLKK